MKQITAKEAANNFSTVMKAVEENGIISITKYTKEKYVVMTKEEYEKRFTQRESLLEDLKKGIIGDYCHKPTYSEGVAKIKCEGGQIIIKLVNISNNEPLSYIETIIPIEFIRLSKTSVWQIEYDIRQLMINGFKETGVSHFDEEFETPDIQNKIKGILEEYNSTETPEEIEIIW